MRVHKYKNYEEYKKIQVMANKQKIKSVFADGNAIKKVLVPYILSVIDSPKFGICHGTRNGTEQQSFITGFMDNNLTVDILGTEISDTAKNYPNTIEWDFHEVKDEWINSVDFIYSNSFDHSYKPKECLDSWMSCLNDKGLCFIEWTEDANGNSRPMDPFAASFDEYKELIQEKYELVEVLENEPNKDEGQDYQGQRFYFVIRNLK